MVKTPLTEETGGDENIFVAAPNLAWDGNLYGEGWSIGLGRSPWRLSTAPDDVRAGTASAAATCADQASACWRIDPQLQVLMHSTMPVWGNTRGYPLNLDVYNLPATTNYPPLSQEAWASTAPFVSVPGDQTYRPLFLADRKVVAGVVDPITGQPLIREEDLDLPVGRATFRMIRTYGGNADGSGGPPKKLYDGQGDRLAIGKVWDWAGTGWMISENPILLFDAQYIQHEPSLPRRCFLILDAHHSIPFTQDIQTGNYIAPAWFDAIMTWRELDPADAGLPAASGQSTNATTWQWAVSPRTVKVKLYGESVTYTFRINYDDMSPLTDGGARLNADAHASPRINTATGITVQPPSAAGGGLGTPYTAFLESIKDRFGNKAVIEHCVNRKYGVRVFPNQVDESCESCVHTCAEKGQIKTVKLYRAGDDVTPEWTLLYVHRSFRVWAPDLAQNPCPVPPDQPSSSVPIKVSPILTSAKDTESKWFLQNALHAVFVYRRDAQVQMPPVPPEGWTLPAEAFVGENDQQGFTSFYPGLDNQDEAGWTERKISQHLHWTVPAGWQYRLRYTYDETIKPIGGCVSPSQYWHPTNESNETCCVIIPDASNACWPVPVVTPTAYTQFGQRQFSDLPGIFFWGTPLEVKEDTQMQLYVKPRLTPCLLRTERTERPKGSSGRDRTTFTGYMYATHLDKPTQLLDRGLTLTGWSALDVDRSEHFTQQLIDHTDERIVPKLKHIFHDDRLRDAMRANNSTSINSIFDPCPDPSSDRSPSPNANNCKCYADQANLTLDWASLSTGVSGAGGRSPWVTNPTGLIGLCVLSQVERERLFVRDQGSIALVGRVRLNDGGTSDGVYDLMYLGVHPPQSSWQSSGFSGSAPVLGLSPQAYLSWDLPDTYTLFPFTWRRLAINDALLSGNISFATTQVGGESSFPLVDAPLGEPMFMTLIDRHDGACSGKGERSEREPYMMRHLYGVADDQDPNIQGKDASGPQGHIMLPHQRQLVGLNPAGFLLFERNWDYQNDGVTAVGPTEEFIYEGTTTPTAMPDGSTRDLTTGMRLTEHRSLGWGVAYVHDIQGNNVGTEGGCTPVSCQTRACICNDRGLITLYGYHDYEETPPGGPPVRIVHSNLVNSVMLKEGLNGDPRALSRTTYDSALQVKEQSRFVLGSDGLSRSSMTTNRHAEYYDIDTAAAPTGPKIMWETVWQSGARPWPAAPGLLKPFECKYYDTKGMLIGRAYGQCGAMSDRGVPGPGAAPSGMDDDGTTVFIDVYGYNRDGQKVIEVVDADIPATGEGSPNVPVYRQEWAQLFLGDSTPPVERLPTQAQIDQFAAATQAFAHRIVPASLRHLLPPLNRTTAYGYSVERSLEIVSKPDGRYDFFVERPVDVLGVPSGEERMFETARISTTYFDVTCTHGTWTPNKAGQVATVLSGRPMRTWSVRWPNVAILDGVPKFAASVASAPAEMFTPPMDPHMVDVGAPVISNHEPFAAIAAVRPVYDSKGRPTTVKAVGLENPNAASSRTEELERVATYTDFGLVGKRIEPSKTLHRTVTTPFGQLIAEFAGTRDLSPCWQEGGCGDGPCDNMALTARHFYGEGINNIRQPVLTRHFRNQILCGDTDYHGRGGTSFASDTTGWEEASGYDRRGRRCAAEVFGAPTADQDSGGPRRQPNSNDPLDSMFGEADTAGGGPRLLLRAEYTWYDHQDRVRFTAAFAPHDAEALRGTSIDPRSRNVYTLGDPSAQEILGAHPLRLSESIYNDRGDLEESVEYDVKNSAQLGTLAHRSTRMYYDHGGHVTTRVSPSGRWERMTYDALGRLVATSVMRGEISSVAGENAYEVERSDNAYHENGQVERSSHIVRIDPDAAPSGVHILTTGPGGNAVRTDTLTWFDGSARPVASAGLGTGWFDSTPDPSRPNGLFANLSSTPPQGPSVSGSVYATPPTWDEPTRRWTAPWMTGQSADFAQVSTTEYDQTGRVARNRSAGGVLTVKKYDGLNRVVMEQTFPAGAGEDLSKAQIVAYQYKNGKLVKIAAPRPGHITTGDPRTRFSNNHDPSIQITELVYGGADSGAGGVDSARIVDPATGSLVSKNYDLLRGIRFPSGGCRCDINHSGALTIQDVFDFLILYFTADMEADFNDSGDVSVQDVFDFLACWFIPTNCQRQWSTAANDGVDIQFEYTLDGLIHSRSELTTISGNSDSVKRTLAFTYDHLGRRTGVGVTSGSVDVPDAVERTRYVYDPLDQLVKATAEARDHALECLYPVATSLFTHDSFGSLTSEKLLHGAVKADVVEALRYNWRYTVTAQGPPAEGAGDGSEASDAPGQVIVASLASMTYPWGAGHDGSAAAGPGHRGRVSYGYGQPFSGQADASWLDGSLYRVQSINWTPSTDGSVADMPIVRYGYAGASMRASLTLGPGTLPTTHHDAIVQSASRGNSAIAALSGRPALSGLDRFGRIRDLNYVWGQTLLDSDTRARRQYQYDDARGGLLMAERVTQQQQTGGGPGGTTGSDRSWSYSYDGFGRLASAATGPLNAAWSFDAINRRSFQQDWTLDELGNWFGTRPSGSDGAPGLHERRFDLAGNLIGLETSRTQATDPRNQIGSQVYDVIDHGSGSHPDAVEVKYAYDQAGRMVYDGRLVYDSDAFGRVVQIREVLKEFEVDPGGGFEIPPDPKVGRLIVHYSYDALGRVVRTQRPVGDSTKRLAITDLYCDGARVVQEVGWASITGRDAGNDLVFLPRAAGEVTGDGANGDAGHCAPAGPGAGWAWADRRLEREYLWHADPTPQGAYVDDCAAQLVYTQAHTWNGSTGAETGDDATPTVLYVLGGHNADVIALADALGRLSAQYSYTPYGELRAAEFFVPGSDSLASESRAAAAGSRLGRQGLRAERTDRPWDGALEPGPAASVGGSSTGPYRGLYHNRNRIYDPTEGRFTAVDPNGLGGPVMSGLVSGGMAITAPDLTPDIHGHYGDGMNANIAYGASPLMGRDPQGLSYWDDYSEDLGQGTNIVFHAVSTFLSFTDAGGLIGSVLESLVSNYSQNLDADADWATDWSMQDDWHSRNSSEWVRESMLLGAYRHFGLDYWNDGEWTGSETSGPAMAGALESTIRVAGKVMRVGGQLHHAMPRFLSKFFKGVNEIVCRMPTTLHSDFHAGLDTLLRRDGFPAMNQPQKWLRFMEGDPLKIHLIRMRVRQFSAQFELEHNLTGLLDAVDQSIP